MKNKEYFYCDHCHTRFKKNLLVTNGDTIIRCINCGKLIPNDSEVDLTGTMDDLNMRLS